VKGVPETGQWPVSALNGRTQHRYMQVEALSKIDTAEVDPILSIPTEAA
jgi:hypothetical protein